MVEQYKDRVFNTCLGFLENRQEAEDVAQEVFIEVYRSIGDFRGEAKFSTWLYRIAVSKSLEEIRRKKRKKRFAFLVSVEQHDGIAETMIDPETESHPLSQLENKERATVLFTALNSLAESQRVAFTLHKVEGLSYEEVSEVMHTSLSSVQSLIHRARQNLKERLRTYYLEEQGTGARE